MKTNFFLLIILFVGCKQFNKDEQTHVFKKDFQKNIMFNHLFVVLDDPTYNYLLDSLKILDDFSRNEESTVDAGEESWSGKYMHGKNHYLEIFKPGGSQNDKFGDFGISFMTNKLGTIDSLQKYWITTTDSITLSNRVYVEDDGKSYPWFRYLSIPNPDSLKIMPWLMENEKELMISIGFTEEDLLHEIEYRDYLKYTMAKQKGISLDSVKYEKAFDKVTSLYLTLSEAELSLLREYLIAFGFTEKNKTFSGNDIDINYSISKSEHFILDQIDFSLLDSLPNGKYQFRNLEFNVDGNKASLKFRYNKEI